MFHHVPRAGFTLIELLVVVAIVALLVSLLVPSLGKARAFAHSAVCRTHLEGAGKALHMYTAEYDAWLAGPYTTGRDLNDNTHVWGNDSDEPTQNMDWISPTLGETLGLPGQRKERLLAILNNDMRCPANKETAAMPSLTNTGTCSTTTA